MIHAPLGFTTNSLTKSSIRAGFILSQRFPDSGYSFMYNVFSRNVYISKELIRDIAGLSLMPLLVAPKHFRNHYDLGGSRELFITHTELILSKYTQLDIQYHIHEQLNAIKIFSEDMPTYLSLVDFIACIEYMSSNYTQLNISENAAMEIR